MEVGRVSKITLDNTMAKTALSHERRREIPVDSKIAIKSFGILGDKYIEITPGKSTRTMKDGEELKNVVSYADYDEIFQNVSTAAKNFGDTMEQFKGVLGEKEKKNLRTASKTSSGEQRFQGDVDAEQGECEPDRDECGRGEPQARTNG